MDNTHILTLLKKSRRGIFNLIFSRTGLILVLLLVQCAVLFVGFWKFEEFLPHFFGGTTLFTAVMVLILLNGRHDPTSKITWLVIIMLVPVFGALLYLFTQSEIGHRALKKRIQSRILGTRSLTPQDPQVAAAFAREDPGADGLARYLRRVGHFPVYQNWESEYFPSGEAKFQRMLQELEGAQKFIFLEYFIVDEGEMWGSILDILARKAAEGVEVRMLYDGTCEFSLLPRDYPSRLQALGIRCKVFAPVAPFVSTHYNYRDHRKILVVDGHTAFTGGVNLADEYINRRERFGHWKDTAIMIKGPAVSSFTLMFLQMWSIDDRAPRLAKYLAAPASQPVQPSGYVIPYGDCPLDDKRVGQQVYMDILNRAKRYVHIMTPYLIMDGELENAMKYAAERGVDVKLILPGIPDKITAYTLAKTHYPSLLDSGVQIFEYTPGFVHAKVFVCDDLEAVVGTINLDYRSLYHHFECAAYLYNTDSISNIEQDFQATQAQCCQVTRETIHGEKWWMKLMGRLLKVVAPLL